MERISLKSTAFFVIFFLASSGLWGEYEGGAEAFHLRCPRTIDCNQVCNGFPNCCIDGQCYCNPCPSIAHQHLPLNV
ncbi:hypothetical protein P3X46_032040 [Hevea brasiliensis]|uniref:Uncharacterized protein n=1 Tax=Hevea brasiliensis TaxID=3981 RepID=A0ABQ9KMW8_HEVBR|nr:hypothetical protein P3X46_032040 [Hevea brasiliensis]KAJ9141513.1 hypothetical protein P3X46_032040 [Hevea brasiliensis]